MARQGISKGGLSTFTGPDGTVEIKTFTCCHCNRIFDVPPKDSPETGFCSQCHARECLRCARKNKCVPFEKKLERYEARQRLLQQIG